MMRHEDARSIAAALGAAALFGASTPLAKQLLAETDPIMLAALLYLGSGAGLLTWRLARGLSLRDTGLARRDMPWLAAAIVAGGVMGPVLLMLGLARTSGAAGSLLLNLEAVFTATLAWLVFGENADRRIVAGMICIAAGGAALAWPGGAIGASNLAGSVLIAGACLAWAIDNNLTRKVSGGDATVIAALKGLVAGSVNLALALATGAHIPGAMATTGALVVGLVGYGISLALFVRALRGLGAARTGAYFSTAPFVGAALAVGLLGEPTPWQFWAAAALMGAGVWLHLTERHEHPHAHEPIEHSHLHRHDEHHRHSHDVQWEAAAPHGHRHRHEPLVHAHPHYPDLHHAHRHDRDRED